MPSVTRSTVADDIEAAPTKPPAHAEADTVEFATPRDAGHAARRVDTGPDMGSSSDASHGPATAHRPSCKLNAWAPPARLAATTPSIMSATTAAAGLPRTATETVAEPSAL